jgi:hypothetical protein
MPTYTLRGVEVDFPYEAYDCQVMPRSGEGPRARKLALLFVFVVRILLTRSSSQRARPLFLSSLPSTH